MPSTSGAPQTSPFFVLIQDHPTPLPPPSVTLTAIALATTPVVYPDEVHYLFEDDSEVDLEGQADDPEKTVIIMNMDDDGHLQLVHSLDPAWQPFEYLTQLAPADILPAPAPTLYRRVVIKGCSPLLGPTPVAPYTTQSDLNALIKLYNERSERLEKLSVMN